MLFEITITWGFFLRFCTLKKYTEADTTRPNEGARHGPFPVVKNPAALNYLSRIKIRCYLRPQPASSMPNSRIIQPPAVWVYKWHRRGTFFLLFFHFHHINGMKHSCHTVLVLWHYIMWLPCFLWPIQGYKVQNIRFLFFSNRMGKNWFWHLMPTLTWDEILSYKLRIC